MPTTIESLPFECLHRILEFVHEWDDETLDQRAYTSILRSLGRTSLVARKWTAPSQELMWSHLCILDNPSTQLKSPLAGKLRSEVVQIWVETLEHEGVSLAWVLQRVKGLRELHLDYEGPYDGCGYGADWLLYPGLKDLKRIALNLPIGLVPLPFEPQQRLTTMNLGRRLDSPAVLEALFRSSSSTLSYLTLKYLDPSMNAALLASLPLVRDSLATLNLTGMIDGLAPVLGAFTVLSNLIVEFGHGAELVQLDELLQALDPPIPTLHVTVLRTRCGAAGGKEGVEALIVSKLNDRLGRREWRGLNLLELGATMDELVREPGGQALVKFCEEREELSLSTADEDEE